MADLILHIGMHKTGSSAIQASLRAADGRDFIYPKLGRPPIKPHHTDALVKLFSSKSKQIAERYRLSAKSFRASNEDEARIRQAAAAAGNRSVILSSEGAYTFLTKEDLVGLRRFVGELFDGVRIVAYVRDPVSYLSSSLQQTIKTARVSELSPQYKKYRNFKKFDKIFGRDNVFLWSYDRSTFPNGDVVDHFCTRLGLDKPPSEAVNESISRPAISAIFRLNRAIAGHAGKDVLQAHKEARIAIIQGFPHRDWPAFRLSPKVVEPLIEANSADIAWVEQRIGRRLRGIHAPQGDDISNEGELMTIDPRAREQLRTLVDTLQPPAAELLKRALAD